MRLVQILFLSLLAWASCCTASDIPILTKAVTCSSGLITNGGFSATLAPGIQFHWKLKDNYVLEAAIRYEGTGWVALGFSPNGEMIGSKAVIGIPNSSGQGNPKLYDLNSTATDASGIMETTYDNHVDGSIIQVNGRTTLIFETSNWHSAHFEDGLYTFIFAVGQDNTLGFHKHANRFRLDLNICKDTGVPGTDDVTSAYDHRAAFVAHGVFASLAFALVIPTAIASAMFRSLMPKMWIYVHVMSNCLAFLFIVIAVASAFGGMVMRSKDTETLPTHMDRVHHWVGLILFLTVCWQVLNGFRRPPVEPKPELKTDPDMYGDVDYQKSSCCGIAKPETMREKWQFIHRLSAFTIVVLAMYQVQSGIRLYMYEYTTYWIWLTLVGLGFVYLYCLVLKREAKQRQMLRPNRNLMPQRDDEIVTMKDGSFNVI